ncbi:MAG: LPS-assembly protein LptD [Planctomycetota bacterium]|jgi:hypothetical protein
MKIGKWIFLVLASLLLMPGGICRAVDEVKGSPFAGQDLHIRGNELISYQLSTSEHTLVFPGKFSMLIGANRFSSDSAVVWLRSKTTEFKGRSRIDYSVRVYLEGNIASEKGKSSKAAGLAETIIEKDKSMMVDFEVSGEVFVTADKRKITDPRNLELYKRAIAVEVSEGPKFVVQPDAVVPQFPPEKKLAKKAEKKLAAKRGLFGIAKKEKREEKLERAEPEQPILGKELVARVKKEIPLQRDEKERKEPKFRYPINFAPAGEEPLDFDYSAYEKGEKVVVITQRFYVWQKQEDESLLELQADSAVVFFAGEGTELEKETENILAGNNVETIYMSGNVLITEGTRTIRADEIYYDFNQKKALMTNAVIRNFDVKRGIPVYVRAVKLRQLAENKFQADDVTLTSSEFFVPQVSATVSKMILTDTTAADQRKGEVSDRSFDAQMWDTRMNYNKNTLFYWPFMRSNLQRPDVPIKRASIGNDNTWGTSVETEWYLCRLLGLREPEGTESTFMADYYSKRGVGAGVGIEYEREDYFGNLMGYIIKDSGDDRLGRQRKNIEHEEEYRGRFSWLHRQFLPYNWQLTTGLYYLTDQNFMEQYYRSEFYSAPERETYIHLKRLQDNWALDFLGKVRINDFDDELAELPSIGHHLLGQSLFNDKFTLYSDTRVGRYRQRIGQRHSIAMDGDHFTFGSHRSEIDMPFQTGALKVVPFVAGTFGYDDRSGFRRTLVDGTDTGSFGEDKVYLGEVGVRIFPLPLWKTYPNIKSRLWDLNQLRHIIEPQLTAALYEESDNVVEQRDIINFAVSQRLQTKRQQGGEQRTVDWMRLDTDITWVSDSDKEASSVGVDRFLWAKPIVPLRVFSAPDIFNGDFGASLQRFEMFGPRRDYIGMDYVWRVSDTAAILSDMYFDVKSSVVSQFNFGFSRLVWPNLSYYIGSRYLRRVEILDEKGSNAFTFAATYVLDPRYTVVFSQQFDFDYGANIRSDITLIRRYHRVYCGFTYSADASMDTQAVVLSIWPQGVPELSAGPRRYMTISDSTAGY